MSGYAVIYDKASVDSFCVSAAYNQIKSLIDDRSYRVEYFSERPNSIEGSPDNSARLFVIPGGYFLRGGALRGGNCGHAQTSPHPLRDARPR